jgi:hypothetical protein
MVGVLASLLSFKSSGLLFPSPGASGAEPAQVVKYLARLIEIDFLIKLASGTP